MGGEVRLQLSVQDVRNTATLDQDNNAASCSQRNYIVALDLIRELKLETGARRGKI